MDLDESFSSESSVDSDEEVNIFCIYSTTIHIVKRSKENRQDLAQHAQQLAVGVLLLN